MAAATSSIAGARDATDTSRAPCKFFILFYFSYYTTIFFRSGDGSNSGRGSRRDMSRATGMLYIYIVLIFLGPLNASTPGSDAGSEWCVWCIIRALGHFQYHKQQQMGLETRGVSNSSHIYGKPPGGISSFVLCFLFFILAMTNKIGRAHVWTPVTP